MIMLLLTYAAFVAAATQTPPPEIIHVRSSFLCTTVRKTLADAIDQLHSNDALIDKGNTLVHRMGSDVVADPGSITATGGQSVAMQMDEMQIESVLTSMDKNLTLADQLLGDPAKFPSAPKNENEEALLQAKGDLQLVVSEQREAMNVLYGMVRTNESRDLQSRRDPVPDDANGHAGSNPRTIVDPRPLQYYSERTRRVEAEAQPAIAALADACAQ